MDGLVSYSLPIKGLHNGAHVFVFHVGKEFFKHFEHSPVEASAIVLTLTLDKRPGLMTLGFEFSGTIETECDRCLAPIHLPVADHRVLVVKYSEEVEPEDADVIYIHPEASSLDVSPYVYELIVLSLPMIKVYDCSAENPPVCDFEMLRFLEQKSEPPIDETSEENPVWKNLKDLYDKA
jgi:uncharacterized metal-binding protein YceD (DUF177 family)